MKSEWRRFKPIGTSGDMKKLNQLLSEKDLTTEDLILIFKCLKPIWRNILLSFYLKWF